MHQRDGAVACATPDFPSYSAARHIQSQADIPKDRPTGSLHDARRPLHTCPSAPHCCVAGDRTQPQEAQVRVRLGQGPLHVAECGSHAAPAASFSRTLQLAGRACEFIIIDYPFHSVAGWLADDKPL
ncbi:hypothetical protein BC831DRAFT_474969 [Entophlyctis helioformis]|nr:hypothetical protein BC831DRAFT_474969 [Entophlyctis helioformis]